MKCNKIYLENIINKMNVLTKSKSKRNMIKNSSDKERNVFQQETKKQNVIKQDIKCTHFTNDFFYRKKKKIISRSYIIIQFPSQKHHGQLLQDF